jgi:uncharacterized protein
MLRFAMLFNVSGLVQEGIGATRWYEVDGELRGEGREPEPVTGTVEMLRTKAGVLVRAHLKLVEPETCSRCLEPLQETLSIEFEEEFQTTVDVHTGQAITEGIDEDAFKIDQNHMLDLTEAVRQYREASAEMQPLCRPDCRGLCPRCGKNLNEGACDCTASQADNRWAALTGLLPDTERKE